MLKINRSITFILTSHPLNRSPVVVMLTNRKRKHTDLRKLKNRSSKIQLNSKTKVLKRN